MLNLGQEQCFVGPDLHASSLQRFPAEKLVGKKFSLPPSSDLLSVNNPWE